MPEGTNLLGVTSSFYTFFYTFSNLVVIITVCLLNVLTLNKTLNDNSEYMLLTGGVTRSKLLLGKILGIVLFNMCVYILVWAVNSIIVNVYGLGSLDKSIFINTMFYCCNSILVSLLALLLIVIFRSSTISLLPILCYIVYNLYFNNSVIMKGEVSTAFRIINGIFPIFSPKKVGQEDLMNVVSTYKVTNQLQVYHGMVFFVIYIISLVCICLAIYKRRDL